MAFSSSSSPAPARRSAPRSSTGHQQPQQQNRELLRQLGGSRAAASRLHWRNALVSQNLGLVHMVANRERLRSGRPFDDLCSAGYEGLIRAVECFDTCRDVALSSFAVPYIQGAMRMRSTRRQQLAWHARRLQGQQRAQRLQEKRRAAGHGPLGPTELAEALGCSLARLQEAGRGAARLGRGQPDQPLGCSDDEAGGSRLEQISASRPGSAEDGAVTPGTSIGYARQHGAWPEPADRELLDARWIDGLSWDAVAAAWAATPGLPERGAKP